MYYNNLFVMNKFVLTYCLLDVTLDFVKTNLLHKIIFLYNLTNLTLVAISYIKIITTYLVFIEMGVLQLLPDD